MNVLLNKKWMENVKPHKQITCCLTKCSFCILEESKSFMSNSKVKLGVEFDLKLKSKKSRGAVKGKHQPFTVFICRILQGPYNSPVVTARKNRELSMCQALCWELQMHCLIHLSLLWEAGVGTLKSLVKTVRPGRAKDGTSQWWSHNEHRQSTEEQCWHQHLPPLYAC